FRCTRIAPGGALDAAYLEHVPEVCADFVAYPDQDRLERIAREMQLLVIAGGRHRYDPLEMYRACGDGFAAGDELRAEQVADVRAVVMTGRRVEQHRGRILYRQGKARNVARVSVIKTLVPPSSPVDVTVLIQHDERGAVFQRVRISARSLMGSLMAARIDGRVVLRHEALLCRLRAVHARAGAWAGACER